LQGTAAASQVQRRVRERFGERETVSRAARRILRAFVDWGVLLETDKKGIYCGAPKRTVAGRQLTVWVIKAVLIAKSGMPQSPTGLLRGHYLFPFDIAPPSMSELESCDAFEVNRHGLDHEAYVSLRTIVARSLTRSS
jgi:hypothetical protein